MNSKLRTRKNGRVQKVIGPYHLGFPELAQIEIEGADELYKEIRIENALEDGRGERVRMQEGDLVDVVIEASATAAGSKKK